MEAKSASHRRAADLTSVLSTDCRSNVERPIIFRTSAVAVCCCSDSRSTRLDGRGLQRHNPFDDTHPAYNLPTDLDGGGSLQVLCVGNVDVIIGVNAGKPSEPFMKFLGAIAHDVVGANAKSAIALASQCYRNALHHKEGKEGMHSGDPVSTSNLQVDCRVDNNFISFGIFSTISHKSCKLKIHDRMPLFSVLTVAAEWGTRFRRGKLSAVGTCGDFQE